MTEISTAAMKTSGLTKENRFFISLHET